MGKGDSRNSRKTLQRKAQRRLKAKIKKVAAERAARFAAGAGKTAEAKKTRTRKPAASASSAS